MPRGHLMLDALVQIDAVVHPYPHTQRHYRQGRDLEANTQQGHQCIAQHRDNRQGHQNAQHRAHRTKGQQAEQRHREEQRRQHHQFGLLDRFVGGRHNADIAPRQLELHTGHMDAGDDTFGLSQHMGHGGAFVVGQEHQNLHLLAAVRYQSRVRRIGVGALLQTLGGTGDGRPARVAFVVAGNHLLAHPRYALHRLHTADFTHLEVECFHRSHDGRVQAGFTAIANGQKHRKHIQADGVTADDFLVVLVVARVGPQLRRAGADITSGQFAGLDRACRQQQQAQGKHPECRSRCGQRRQSPPQGVTRAGNARPGRHQVRLELQMGDE